MLNSQKGFIGQALMVLLLVAGIGLGTYLVQQRTNLKPKAQEIQQASEWEQTCPPDKVAFCNRTIGDSGLPQSPGMCYKHKYSNSERCVHRSDIGCQRMFGDGYYYDQATDRCQQANPGSIPGNASCDPQQKYYPGDVWYSSCDQTGYKSKYTCLATGGGGRTIDEQRIKCINDEPATCDGVHKINERWKERCSKNPGYKIEKLCNSDLKIATSILLDPTCKPPASSDSDSAPAAQSAVPPAVQPGKAATPGQGTQQTSQTSQTSPAQCTKKTCAYSQADGKCYAGVCKDPANCGFNKDCIPDPDRVCSNEEIKCTAAGSYGTINQSGSSETPSSEGLFSIPFGFINLGTPDKLDDLKSQSQTAFKNYQIYSRILQGLKEKGIDVTRAQSLIDQGQAQTNACIK